MPTYHTSNPLARTSPLRSIPFFQPASILARDIVLPTVATLPTIMDSDWQLPAAYEVTNQQKAVRELANAEAAFRDIVRVYDAARAGIGEANRTSLPGVQNRPAIRLSSERIRQRKSYAFAMFNKRRGELSRARRRVNAARVALGQPSLAATEKRTTVAIVVRASKRRSVVHHPIASVAAHVA